MSVRVFVPLPLSEGQELALPPEAVRHVQVLRHQPGDVLTLFNGQGCDWPAQVLSMGRQQVVVRVGQGTAVDSELKLAVTLAVVMPANDRMDFLVEKATELGVAALQPLMSERSVLRLSGERAQKKQAHWQAVAVAAAGQCGRARVPEVAAVQALGSWLAGLPAEPQARWLLSPLAPQALQKSAWPTHRLTVLSGPEGGLSREEEALAQRQGFVPQSLGPRILRADTAPLAVLACASLMGA